MAPNSASRLWWFSLLGVLAAVLLQRSSAVGLASSAATWPHPVHFASQRPAEKSACQAFSSGSRCVRPSLPPRVGSKSIALHDLHGTSQTSLRRQQVALCGHHDAKRPPCSSEECSQLCQDLGEHGCCQYNNHSDVSNPGTCFFVHSAATTVKAAAADLHASVCTGFASSAAAMASPGECAPGFARYPICASYPNPNGDMMRCHRCSLKRHCGPTAKQVKVSEDGTRCVCLDKPEEEKPMTCSLKAPAMEPNEWILDFCPSKVEQNNLGGVGPDAGDEELRFGKITETPQGWIDLVIVVVGPYEIAQDGRNGKTFPHGTFGLVNVLQGTTVDVIFRFEHSRTREPATLPHFIFTFADMSDTDERDGRQTVTVGGFKDYYVTPTTELRTEAGPEGKTIFSSAGPPSGDAAPPTAPWQMSPDQANRAFSLLFEDTSTFKATLKVGAMPDSPMKGRNFSLAGKSSGLTCFKPSCPKPTTTVTTPTPVNTCRTGKGAEEPGEVVLDFESAVVMNNNLGDLGPDTGLEELRYSRIAKTSDGFVDLVIVASGTYSKAKESSNGKAGALGRINLLGDVEVELSFKFVKAGTEESVILDLFYFTLMDLDADQAREQVSIGGFEAYFVTSATEVLASTGDDGRVTFHSKSESQRSANAEDPFDLTDEQADQAVTLKFRHTSLFRVKLSLAAEDTSNQAKYFMFTGKSGLLTCSAAKLLLPQLTGNVSALA